MEFTPSGSLEEQVADLRRRAFRLEEALLARGASLPVEEPAKSSAVAQSVAQSIPSPQAQPVQSASKPAQAAPTRPWTQAPFTGQSSAGAAWNQPASSTHDGSLESRIGSQWFNRIGILAVLIGMAWFIKFAIDNQWIGPLGRILIGLVAGAGLIAWSEKFRGKGFVIFSYSLKAIGSGVLYLSLWAAFSVYQLVPSGAAFFAMIVVTAFNGLMAWVQDAELLALYAIVGGISTPVLLSTGENHEITLFSYLLLIDLAVLILVALKPWSRLLFVAFAGTILMVTGWWIGYYSADQRARTSLFVALFFLTFALAPRLVRIELQEGVEPSGWNALAMLVLPALNAGLGFLAFYVLYDRAGTEWATPWIAVLFAAFYLAMQRLPAQGKLHESPALLSALHLAAAVAFLTIAIPLKAQGRWLTTGWLAEGAALMWVAQRMGMRLLRVMAIGCFALGLGALLTVNPAASQTPIFNSRFAAYAFAIGAFGFVARLSLHAAEQEQNDSGLSWSSLAATSVLLINLLALIAISLEINAFWQARSVLNDYESWRASSIYAQFSYSAFFMLYGAILLALGFMRRSSFLRWQALVLLAFSIGKVFLVDMSELSQGFRILSFLVLGALLLAVSFVYQRDWLYLRGAGKS
ncbi:MAG: DUF2339 domain-containing protein [Acidobacteriota bacterium]|nr:DUF2339 domain-containing protein [Acidobacteriota bacterium]